MHIPNPETYRLYLGKEMNEVLFILAKHKNSDALIELSVTDYLFKIIKHWRDQEFPQVPFPCETKKYYKDLDFVQSVKT